MTVKRNSKRDKAVATKQKQPYEIDGKQYKSKALMEYHSELKRNKFVKSFNLPTVDRDKEARNGKFNSYTVIVNGISFDSIMESRFYLHLLDLKKSGDIKDFELQVTFELQPKFRTQAGEAIRAITYIADFVVTNKDGDIFIVDVKGKETDVFKIKRKMLLYQRPEIQFLCVRWINKEKTWANLEDIKGKTKKGAKRNARTCH